MISRVVNCDLTTPFLLNMFKILCRNVFGYTSLPSGSDIKFQRGIGKKKFKDTAAVNEDIPTNTTD